MSLVAVAAFAVGCGGDAGPRVQKTSDADKDAKPPVVEPAKNPAPGSGAGNSGGAAGIGAPEK